MNRPITRRGNRPVIRATGRIGGDRPQLVRPATGRRRLVVLALVLVLGCGILLAQNFRQIGDYVNRPITKVRMENQWQQIAVGEVRELLANYMGDGFFSFDMGAVKAELELHPWVQRAAIKKLWPDSLSLQLTEQVPIARWNNEGLLNQQGEIFLPPGADRLDELPILSGPEQSQSRVMEQFQRINQQLFSSGLRLTGLALSHRGSWSLRLNETIDVTVGRDRIMERLQRFLEFYQAQPLSSMATVESVDLRYENGIAIRKTDTELAELAVR